MDLMLIMYSTEHFAPNANISRPERFSKVENSIISKGMEPVVELAFGHRRWGCAGVPSALMELSKGYSFEVSPVKRKRIRCCSLFDIGNLGVATFLT